VGTGQVAGAVGMATARGGPSYVGAFGARSSVNSSRMTPDTLFEVSALLRPILAVAALQLVDGEMLGLDEPLRAALPELAAARVLDGFDRTGALRRAAPVQGQGGRRLAGRGRRRRPPEPLRHAEGLLRVRRGGAGRAARGQPEQRRQLAHVLLDRPGSEVAGLVFPQPTDGAAAAEQLFGEFQRSIYTERDPRVRRGHSTPNGPDTWPIVPPEVWWPF
jgi:hypothetical protein